MTKFTIPKPLQCEHEALHERLRQATQAGGEWNAEMAAALVGPVVRQRLGPRAGAAA